MNLQDERIQSACGALSLSAVAEQYPALAQEAADTDASYTDFLEQCLNAEQAERRRRSQATLAKFAGFPAIKLLDDYDFKFRRRCPEKDGTDADVHGLRGAQGERHLPRPQRCGQNSPRDRAWLSGHAVRDQSALRHGRRSGGAA